MTISILCSRCHRLLLQPVPSKVSGSCSACGWRGLPQFTTTLPRPPLSLQKSFSQSGLEHLWLAAPGHLQVLSAIQGEWQTISLPNTWTIKGLAFSSDFLLISPKEENTLGESKPFLGIKPGNRRNIVAGGERWHSMDCACCRSVPCLRGGQSRASRCRSSTHGGGVVETSYFAWQLSALGDFSRFEYFVCPAY